MNIGRASALPGLYKTTPLVGGGGRPRVRAGQCGQLVSGTGAEYSAGADRLCVPGGRAEDGRRHGRTETDATFGDGGIGLKMEGTFGSLAPFDCNEPSKWSAWKRAFVYCLTANAVTDDKRQVALLLHLGGPELQEVFHAIVDEHVKVESLSAAVEILDNYFLPRRNVTYERHMFHKEFQKPGEAIDVFVTRLRGLAKTCEL